MSKNFVLLSKTILPLFFGLVTTGFYGCYNDQVDDSDYSRQNWYFKSSPPGDLTQFVDTRSGSGGLFWASGSTAPTGMAPFGMVKLGPDSATLGFGSRSSGYYYADTEVIGFSHNRYHGTGLKQGGILRVLPSNNTLDIFKLKYHHLPLMHHLEVALPGYYSLYNKKRDITMELTATTRVGVHRYQFGLDQSPHLLIDITSHLSKFQFTDRKEISQQVKNIVVEVRPADNLVVGHFRLFDDLSERHEGLETFFAIFSPQKFNHNFIDGLGGRTDVNLIEKANGKLYLDLGFNASEVNLAVALSYTDEDSAIANLIAEYGIATPQSFEDIAEQNRTLWNEKLSKVSLPAASEASKKLFYNNLYRTFTMPTVYSDAFSDMGSLTRFDKAIAEFQTLSPGFSDPVQSFIGFDKEIHISTHAYYSDLSLWDTFRTAHPLYTLIQPEEHKDMMLSMVKMADHSGRFPRWSGGGYHGDSMLGFAGNIALAEAVLKGIDLGNENHEKALEVMKSMSLGERGPMWALAPPANLKPEGVQCIKEIINLGYCPKNIINGSVSFTLEYAYADYAHSLFAEKLGKTDDAQGFLERSKTYKNNWDSSHRAFVPRYESGAFEEDFNLTETSFVGFSESRHGYFEGSPNQWRWYVPHDPEGLISLFGNGQNGRDVFLRDLKSFFENAKPEIGGADPGGYYWHGNEPDIHAAYLFSHVDRPDLTQRWLRWIMKHKYSLGAQALDGEDDAGTLSAWYVFNSLGIYPIAGTTRYMIGSPIFADATMSIGGGKTIQFKALNFGKENIYVHRVKVNGDILGSPWFDHSLIADGGVIEFEMSDQPSPWNP